MQSTATVPAQNIAKSLLTGAFSGHVSPILTGLRQVNVQSEEAATGKSPDGLRAAMRS